MKIFYYLNTNWKDNLKILFIIIFFLIHFQIFGDWHHYNDFLIGDRAVAMGGAYTAISSDASGIYYNPGGIAFSSDKELSVSTSGFYFNTLKINSFFGATDYKLNDTTFDSLNGFLGYTMKLTMFDEDYFIGFSIYVPDNENNFRRLNFNSSSKLLYSDNSLEINKMNYIKRETQKESNYSVSISKKIFSNLGLGLSVGFFNYQEENLETLNLLLGPFKTNSGEVYKLISGEFDTSALIRGVSLNFGVLYKLIESFSIGLSLNYKYPIIKEALGHSTSSFVITDANSSPLGPGFINSDDGSPVYQYGFLENSINNKSFLKKMPFEIRFGMAWQILNVSLLGLDLDYHTGVHSDIDYFSVKPILNVSLGSDTNIYDNIFLRMGFFTNKYAGTDVSSEGIIDSDFYGVTSGVAYKNDKNSIFSLTAVYQKTFNAKYTINIIDSKSNYPSADLSSLIVMLGISSNL
ncbi:hypothetical protein GCL60_03260 [Silvanigrella paludirubra]|uniref:Uncharacterized protein n=1 Tax=Silvanigrella paludirubra TaxID=2499159 RepID=A0A6N6VZY4_9BACT|nr:hypothetical protein [Silvanigrella paludirubra]KAB8040966.1 hypothetical protein GCL60_03260 [Silvanigrella paludirubra]